MCGAPLSPLSTHAPPIMRVLAPNLTRCLSQSNHTAVVKVPSGVGNVNLPICTSALRFGTRFDIKSQCKFTWPGVPECATEVEVKQLLAAVPVYVMAQYVQSVHVLLGGGP